MACGHERSPLRELTFVAIFIFDLESNLFLELLPTEQMGHKSSRRLATDPDSIVFRDDDVLVRPAHNTLAKQHIDQGVKSLGLVRLGLQRSMIVGAVMEDVNCRLGNDWRCEV